MADEQIRIERIKIKDLYQFACGVVNRAKDDEIIPITKHRALAHAKNPYAAPDDPGLVVAYMGDRVVGYMGLVPGLLRTGDRLSKVYWGSTLYVVPDFRHTGAGILIIKNVLSLKCDHVGADMSPMSEKVWRSLGLVDRIGPLNYYVMDLNKLNCGSFLIRFLRRYFGHQLADTVTRVNDRVIYPAVKSAYYSIVLCRYRKRLNSICHEEVSEVPKDSTGKAQNQPTAAFYRGAEWTNWMLRYRWVLNTHETNTSYANYHFSSARDVFKYIAIKVYSANEKEYKGFLVLSVSRVKMKTVLKVLEFHFADQSDSQYVFLLSLKYARMYGADDIEIPGTISHHFKANSLLKILLSSRKHHYLCHPKNEESPLASAMTTIELNYCDGDNQFT